MSEPVLSEIDAGLCAKCRFARVNRTRRATTYLRCTAAAWDERLVKYPQLPVVTCVGYEGVQGWESVSTWRQKCPAPLSIARASVVAQVAGSVARLGAGRLRVVVDGFTAAGKTSFGHELAAALRERGRPTLRASLDDFKHPWRHATLHGYDRVSGQGYYRNAYDLTSIRTLLLEPAGPQGSGRIVLCAHDPLTGLDHRAISVTALWDYRIWLDVSPEVSLARGIARDTAREGSEAAAASLHHDRYHTAEQIYLAEVDPRSVADVVIDNEDLTRPQITTRRG
jgi:uridine kinase